MQKEENNALNGQLRKKVMLKPTLLLRALRMRVGISQ
jgi:hypothetical protein